MISLPRLLKLLIPVFPFTLPAFIWARDTLLPLFLHPVYPVTLTYKFLHLVNFNLPLFHHSVQSFSIPLPNPLPTPINILSYLPHSPNPSLSQSSTHTYKYPLLSSSLSQPISLFSYPISRPLPSHFPHSPLPFLSYPAYFSALPSLSLSHSPNLLLSSPNPFSSLSSPISLLPLSSPSSSSIQLIQLSN